MQKTFRRYQFNLISFFVIFGEIKGQLNSCKNDDIECQYNANSHLDTIMGVHTMDECHQLCLDQDHCEFVTYYDFSSSPANMCMLFRSCGQTTRCTHCQTDWIGCDKNCLSSTVGTLDETNVIEVFPETVTFQDCRNLCKNNTNCSWFTYFTSGHAQFHEHCFLLNRLVDHQYECDFCVTGPVNCEQSDQCSMSLPGDDNLQDSLTLTSPDTTSVNIHGGSGSCSLRVLLVGGGGDATGQLEGGGGSGYVTAHTVKLQSGNAEMAVRVGKAGEVSEVTLYDSTLFTQSGADGKDSSGGNGFSGGGYMMPGGSDGGNGWGTKGGSGSGLDLASLPFTSVTLTPGAGGAVYDNILQIYGGGGGGVLVSGGGPETTEHQGQGYGGGGGHGPGLPGDIVLEIASDD